MVADRTARRRPWTVLFVVAWLGVIASVTLLPVASGPRLPSTCFFCGPLGGVDFVLNVVLFVPLGLGLAALVGRTGLVMILALGVTVAIEFLQWRIIPGRDSSLGDVTANALGAATGALLMAALPSWVRARGALARRLTTASAAVAGGVILLGAWLVVPAVPAHGVAVQVTVERPNLDSFDGTVVALRLHDSAIHATQRLQPAALLDSNGTVAIETAVTGPAGRTQRQAMIVAIANQVEEALFVGQWGSAAVFRVHTQANTLRLRTLMVRLEGAFGQEAPRDTQLTLTASASPRAIHLATSSAAGAVGLAFPHTAALAWTALLPWDVALTPGWWPANALWLALIVLPVGYWAAAGGGAPARGWWPGLIPLAAVVAGPLAFGISWPMPGEWAGLVGGIMAGTAAQRLTRAAIRG